MKVTHFKKVSETSGVCVLLRLYLFIIDKIKFIQPVLL